MPIKKGMTRRSFLKGAGALGTAVVVTGFPGVLRGKEPDPIKIGGLYALSGPAAQVGVNNRKGVVFAIEQINADGGIKSLGGAKLQLLDGDVQFKAEVGMAEAERMIREGAVALIGVMISSITYATTQVAEKHHVPHIAVAVADNITERGFKYTFRTEGKNDRIGHELVKNVTEMAKHYNSPIKTAVTFMENTLFGQDAANAVVRWAKKLNAFEVLEKIHYPSATPNLTPEILRAKSLKPDIVIGAAYTADAILKIKTMYDQRFDVKGFVSVASGHVGTPVIKGLGKLSEYILSCTPHPNFKKKRAQVIGEKFKAQFNQPMDLYSGQFYTGVELIADALERAKSRNPEALREALANTHYKDHVECQVEPISFDKSGDNFSAGSPIGQVLNGEFQLVYPLDFAVTKAVFPVPKWSERAL